MPGVADEEFWTKNEDMAIMQEADMRSNREWVQVAEALAKCGGEGERRTAVSCLKRFQRTLNTKLLKWNKWSEEEDGLMREAMKVIHNLVGIE